MDPIALITADHREVEMLFSAFEKQARMQDAKTAQTAELILDALTIHAQLEERLVYPALRAAIDDPEPVLEAFEEHHVAKGLIQELRGLSLGDERFTPKMTVLKELVKHHVEEEESLLLPLLEEKLDHTQRAQLARQYADDQARVRQQTINLNVSMVREYPVEQPKER
jgi:hemerythrin superfamily protein